MLLPRVLTAAAGVPLLLFLIQRGGLAFDAFVVGISALCLYEYGVLLLIGGKPVHRLLTAAAGTGLAVVQVLHGPIEPALALAAAAVLLRELVAARHDLERMALTLFGAVALGWMPAHLALVRDLRPHGRRLAFMTFVSIWACDTAAYFVGGLLGRRKLAPVVSPKKTWEGFFGGLAGSFAVVFLFRALTPGLMTLPRAVAVGLSLGVIGQLSDLAESMIKRAVGAKDSGALLPGHGGILDRFDSFILAAPAVYYCLTL